MRLAVALLLLSLLPLAAAQEDGAWMLHILEARYTPDPLEVPAGATVVIMNFESPENPDGIHTVTAADPSFFDVQQIPAGGEPRTFVAPSTPGTYQYYCRYHGDAQGNGMAGKLVVTAASPTPDPSPSPSPTPAASPRPTPAASPPATASTTPGTNESPGPWLGALLVALAGAALFARRR